MTSFNVESGTLQNLLPSCIAQARRVRSVRKRWTIFIACWCGVLIAGDLALKETMHGPEAASVRAHERLEARLAELAALTDEQRATLADYQRRTELISRVTMRPDWSLLMAALARASRDQVMLASCSVEEPARDGGLRLVVTGVGLEQAAVQAFVLQVEHTGLFGEVVLDETRRVATGGAERVSFRLSADLGSGAERSAQAGGVEAP